MKKYSWIIILANLLLFLGYFNYSVVQKEKLLEQGTLIFMELAPVDPRSLMQGDYMELRYKLTNEMVLDSLPKRGFCAIAPDASGVAHQIRFLADGEKVKPNELLVQYTKRSWWGIHIGAESYFFQEGDVEKYENAKYGGIRVDDEGNSLLIGLYDDHLKRLE
ncbi:GDYXXLXY domain-containing protein [Flagellimonas baculiformis]|uniref:GDYXXLXY domain-containing protein n=1 Tax=Flagellimonas baculiformis TaxID=3067310 RepID=UPI00296EB6DB|nr:GDYXXLXY domain-containing protein [Muricauda sp. D6]